MSRSGTSYSLAVLRLSSTMVVVESGGVQITNLLID